MICRIITGNLTVCFRTYASKLVKVCRQFSKSQKCKPVSIITITENKATMQVSLSITLMVESIEFYQKIAIPSIPSLALWSVKLDCIVQ